MAYQLGKRSLRRLQGVHPDLVAVVKRAIELTEVDFTVLEGVRTLEKQKVLFQSGASKTMNSRHLTGHAVDLGAYVDGQVRWDWPLYHKIADAMLDAAGELGVSIDWGGDWDGDGDYLDETFRDGPHFQLDWSEYPK